MTNDGMTNDMLKNERTRTSESPFRIDRRRFVAGSLAALGFSRCGATADAFALSSPDAGAIGTDQSAPREKLPVAAVVTVYHVNSHADVIVGKILEGWEQDGGPGPDLKLASLYVDQFPASDISRKLAEKHGFPICKTIEEAVTLGSGTTAVAGVLSIGEHGDYPATADTGQVQYPRRRFFDEIAAAMEKGGKFVPVFNDKHLAYTWEDAKHVYDAAKRLGIPFLAGSSIPVAWRRPALTLETGVELTGVCMNGYGGLESYGFHTLEGLQCLIERRKGGETGVARVQAVSGPAIAEAETAGRWSRELLAAAIAADQSEVGKRLREKGLPAEFPAGCTFFLIDYNDGLRAFVPLDTGLCNEFAFAARTAAGQTPATWFQLQDGKPYAHFAHLLRAIEELIHSGKPPYPVERTLLTTGILDAAMRSHAAGGKPIDTPHLAIAYEPSAWPFASDELKPPREVP